MADLAIVAANFRLGQNAQIIPRPVQFGVAVSLGQQVYLDETTRLYLLADNSDTTKSDVGGMVISSAGINGWGFLMTGGDFEPGTAMTIGDTFNLSVNAGAIAPSADTLTGAIITEIGIATSTSIMQYRINVTGAAHG